MRDSQCIPGDPGVHEGARYIWVWTFGYICICCGCCCRRRRRRRCCCCWAFVKIRDYISSYQFQWLVVSFLANIGPNACFQNPWTEGQVMASLQYEPEFEG